MAVKIIPEPDIHITQADADRYRREWEQSQQMTVAPVSFEVWLRGRLNRTDNEFVDARRASIAAGARRADKRFSL